MLAGIAAAGLAQLASLMKRDNSPGTSPAAASTTPPTPPAPATPAGRSGLSSFSADLSQLMLDIQAGANGVAGKPGPTTGATTDPADSIADDIESLFGDLKKLAGVKGHRSHPQALSGSDPAIPPSAANPSPANAPSSPPSLPAGTPYPSLASQLIAYSSAQSLTSPLGAARSLMG